MCRQQSSTAEDSIFIPPRPHQNPLLRQLLRDYHEDFLASLSPPSDRQNPLLRQLAQSSQSDQGSALSPPPVRNSLFIKVIKTMNDDILWLLGRFYLVC